MAFAAGRRGVRRVLALALLTAAAWPSPSAGEAAPVAAEAITLERIMADPDWLGNAPESPYWGEDGATVYFTRDRAGTTLEDLWRIPLATGTPERVPDPELGLVDVDGGHLSSDRRLKVYGHHGDIFVRDLTAGIVRQLTRSDELEREPRFLAGDREIVFERGEKVLVRDLASGLERLAADLRLEKDPAEEEADSDFLSRQQRRLFEIVRRRDEDEERERERQKQLQAADPTRAPLPFYLGEDVEVVARSLSPAGDWMLLVIAEEGRDEGRHDHMAEHVTADGYVATPEVRVKVGTAEPIDHRLWLLDLAGHERREIDLSVLPGIDVDPLAALRAEAEKKSDDEESDGSDESDDEESDKSDKSDKSRPLEIEAIEWTRDGTHAAVQLHSYDNKDRWIALVERDSEALEPIHRLQHDQGWINWSFNEMAWLDDPADPQAHRLWFLSEETGWSQLYLYDAASGRTHRLTDGDYVVEDVEPSRDGAYFYFSANPKHPGIYDTYRVATDRVAADPEAGAGIERLTDLGGISRSRISPDGSALLVLHGARDQPPELYLQAARPAAEARRLTATVSEEWRALPWTVPEIVEVPSSHQARPIHARLYLPVAGSAVAAAGERPAVVFVHGAGYLQNAHHGWSVYFREFMFHTLLTRAGYTVLDMDYRGSRGYGRDWRAAIYRHMGGPELEDLGDGVAYLVAHHGVDPERVGVYGGSYGGFLTMMALFTDPDLFAGGAALRPVTDWAHYNHPYTSNILNTPDVDPEAYARSSPIEFADGLRAPLLICAPMLDDNVFFQDTVRLVQRLIELGKEDWETAIYPVEPHGFLQPSSWRDEYRRIFELFESHLQP